nr:hypothetical protein CFP56_17575 [Quercus suber]
MDPLVIRAATIAKTIGTIRLYKNYKSHCPKETLRSLALALGKFKNHAVISAPRRFTKPVLSSIYIHTFPYPNLLIRVYDS